MSGIVSDSLVWNFSNQDGSSQTVLRQFNRPSTSSGGKNIPLTPGEMISSSAPASTAMTGFPWTSASRAHQGKCLWLAGRQHQNVDLLIYAGPLRLHKRAQKIYPIIRPGGLFQQAAELGSGLPVIPKDQEARFGPHKLRKCFQQDVQTLCRQQAANKSEFDHFGRTLQGRILACTGLINPQGHDLDPLSRIAIFREKRADKIGRRQNSVALQHRMPPRVLFN